MDSAEYLSVRSRAKAAAKRKPRTRRPSKDLSSAQGLRTGPFFTTEFCVHCPECREWNANQPQLINK